MEFKILNKAIVTQSGEKALSIELLKNGAVRIFTKKVKTDLIEICTKKSLKGYTIDENNKTISYGCTTLKINDDLSFILMNNNEEISHFTFDVIEKEAKNCNEISLSVNKNSHVYGLGDKMASMDRMGYSYIQWNHDEDRFQNELLPSLYKSINYLLINSKGTYFALFFASTFPYSVDIAKTKSDEIKISNEYAPNDIFLFMGNDVANITSTYSEIVGHPYFIRMKMLGNNQSRWSYENEEQVYNVVSNFNKYNIPLEYIHCDIHYMDGYRDFTVDKTRFPDMKGLTDKCKKSNVEIVCINDSGVKVDPDYSVYKYCKENDLISTYKGEEFIGTVWPGDAFFPKYFAPKAKEYFANAAENFMKENGFSGLWNDMNEPISFKGELPPDVDFSIPGRKLQHIEEHNVFGEHMIRCFKDIFKKDNLRPYLFTRAAFATTPKYAFAWNGDNYSFWHHLRLSIPQILTMSLSGNMFDGVDIGGFGGDSTKELLIRWCEANILMPFFRNHSSLNTKAQEPYAYDEQTVEIYKHFLGIRYELVPYLYTLTNGISKKGVPMVRPLFYEYPTDEKTFSLNDEYMVGKSILVAPIVDQGSTERVVYFPSGTWMDYETGKVYKGGKSYLVEMPLDKTGIYVKKNAILTCFSNKLTRIEKETIGTLRLKLFGNSGRCDMYEDDGKTLNYENGEFNEYKISYRNNEVEISCTKDGYKSPFKTLEIEKDGIVKSYEFKKNLRVKF